MLSYSAKRELQEIVDVHRTATLGTTITKCRDSTASEIRSDPGNEYEAMIVVYEAYAKHNTTDHDMAHATWRAGYLSHSVDVLVRELKEKANRG